MTIENKEVLDILQHNVVACSSHELEDQSKEFCLRRKGWISEKNCSYPQIIVLRIKHTTDFPVHLSQLQILSHESMIPNKIEIQLASDENINTSDGIDEKQNNIASSSSFERFKNIRRIGFLSFDSKNSNNGNNHCFREMRYVEIGFERVSCVKILIHGNHSNEKINPYNQVGIMSITMIGKVEGEQLCKEFATPDLYCVYQENIKKIEPRLIEITGNQSIELCNQEQQKLHPKAQASEAIKEGNVASQSTNSSGIIMDETIQTRIKRLEDKKREKAEAENFNVAAILKDILHKIQALAQNLLQAEEQMRKAAKEEIYAEASRFKKERDVARNELLKALDDAEEPQLSARTGIHSNEISSTFSSPDRRSKDGGNDMQRVGNLIVDKEEGYCEATFNNDFEICEDEISRGYDEISETGSDDEPSLHPLEGIPGYFDLPSPEDIDDAGGDSRDLIQKIEEMLGAYCSKCFFSKHWSLREAAIHKLSLALPKLAQDKGDFLKYIPTICGILEKVCNDRIIQVFLTGLILLDNLLITMEIINSDNSSDTSMNTSAALPSNVPAFGKLIPILFSRLSDSKPNIIEGAETSLMCMALSNCVGVYPVRTYALKPMKSKRETKGGRAICSRLRFLQRLLEEFEEEAVSVSRVVEFIKDIANGFGHKDADVRDATKELSIVMYKIIGDDILTMMGNCLTERQLREYKASFAVAAEQ